MRYDDNNIVTEYPGSISFQVTQTGLTSGTAYEFRFILRNDSLNSANPIPTDSLQTWLATKQKKYIPVRKPIPLFIRYFTSDVTDEGKLVFYEDIYEEDMRIREKIFANKIL